MGKIIQLKGKKVNKLILLIVGVVFFKVTIGVSRLEVSWNVLISLIPLFPIYAIILFEFSRNAYKVTISNELIIIERLFFSALIIPLESIDEIKELPKYTREPGYVVEFGNKKIYIRTHDFRFIGVSFERVMSELETRVENAKKSDDSK